MSEDFKPAGALPLGELFDNHDGFRPERSDALAGRTITLHGADGTSPVAFADATSLTWDGATAAYEALAVREGVVAVACRLAPGRSLLAVLDLAGRRAIAAETELADGRERTRHWQAGLDVPLAAPFAPTGELVGKRVLYRYSDTHAFEHIYLNPTSYCWHGVEGPERWVGAVDPCVTYRLGEQLYLFSWSEQVAAFNGAVVIDLAARRSVGRFFAWDEAAGAPEQLVVGARAVPLNETRYDEP